MLAAQPHAVVLSFGDPRPFGAVLKAAGCKLICQVQDLATAGLARDAGADLVVAQGSEGGGHGAGRGTLALVPAVVDAVVPIPVLAAGGVADGRGLAAALMLGAQRALIGTRFYASAERSARRVRAITSWRPGRRHHAHPRVRHRARLPLAGALHRAPAQQHFHGALAGARG